MLFLSELNSLQNRAYPHSPPFYRSKKSPRLPLQLAHSFDICAYYTYLALVERELQLQPDEEGEHTYAEHSGEYYGSNGRKT